MTTSGREQGALQSVVKFMVNGDQSRGEWRVFEHNNETEHDDRERSCGEMFGYITSCCSESLDGHRAAKTSSK